MSFFSIYNFSLLLFYLRKDIHFYARKDIKVNLIPTHLSKSQQDRDLPSHPKAQEAGALVPVREVLLLDQARESPTIHRNSQEWLCS